MNEIYRITGLNGWQLIAVIAACVAWCIAFWPHKIPGSNSTFIEKKKPKPPIKDKYGRPRQPVTDKGETR